MSQRITPTTSITIMIVKIGITINFKFVTNSYLTKIRFRAIISITQFGIRVTSFTHFVQVNIYPLPRNFNLLIESKEKIKRILFLNEPLTESIFFETSKGT